jgi:hypothetical protein
MIRPLLALLACLLLAASGNGNAENKHFQEKPVLGWSSWSFIRKDPTATKIKAQAQAMRESGLTKVGYRYVNLDDFWYECPGGQGPNVDQYGRWVTDPAKFPPDGSTNGIKVVADYVHSLGEKFGIYVTPGISKQAVARKTPIRGTRYTADQIADPSIPSKNYNCKGMVGVNFNRPGAQAYINSWADMFASWGVDYIKMDGVTGRNEGDIKAWSLAIRHSGRPMVLNITNSDFSPNLVPVLRKYADQWAFGGDIECYTCEKDGQSYPLSSWANLQRAYNHVAERQPYSAPGHFNNYDSIEVGNGRDDGLTLAERKTQLSLWSLGSSPLILGVDLTHLDPEDLQLLKNTEVLAVDQDAIAARRIVNKGDQQVFAKKEANGDAIVGLFNTGNQAQTISVPASALGLPEDTGGYTLTDLWTHKREKANSAIRASVPAHGVVLYRVSAHPDHP